MPFPILLGQRRSVCDNAELVLSQLGTIASLRNNPIAETVEAIAIMRAGVQTEVR